MLSLKRLSALCAILFAINLGTNLFGAGSAKESQHTKRPLDPKLGAALQQLDSAFNTCFSWWAKVYDPQTRGCFYCISGKQARDNGEKQYGPDIEATSKLVNVLDWTGALAETPQGFKDGIIHFMQERQDPKSGFFRDPEFADDYSANTLDRAASMASGAIEKCGGKVKYPLPLERRGNDAEVDQHFAHLQNPQALTAWLDKQPWDKRIWTCGSHLRSQAGIFKQLKEPLRGQLLDTVEAYLKSKQNSDGYYGSPNADQWFSRLSGTYKAIAFLEANGRAVPMVSTLAKTVLHDLHTRTYTNLIVLYNTANILTILNRNGANFSVGQRADIIQKCTAVLNTFHWKDGGFLTNIDKPSPSANGKLLGKPVMESNTNSTGLAHKTRNLLYELATGKDEARPHAHSKDLINALNEIYQ